MFTLASKTCFTANNSKPSQLKHLLRYLGRELSRAVLIKIFPHDLIEHGISYFFCIVQSGVSLDCVNVCSSRSTTIWVTMLGFPKLHVWSSLFIVACTIEAQRNESREHLQYFHGYHRHMFSLNMFQSVLVWAQLQAIAVDPYTSGRSQATLYNWYFNYCKICITSRFLQLFYFLLKRIV